MVASGSCRHGYLADLADADEAVLVLADFPPLADILQLPHLPLSPAGGGWPMLCPSCGAAAGISGAAGTDGDSTSTSTSTSRVSEAVPGVVGGVMGEDEGTGAGQRQQPGHLREENWQQPQQQTQQPTGEVLPG